MIKCIFMEKVMIMIKFIFMEKVMIMIKFFAYSNISLVSHVLKWSFQGSLSAAV